MSATKIRGDIKIPTEIDCLCPACEKKSTFTFVAYQPVLADKGIMPLYDCSMCGTTRSFTGIIHLNYSK